MMGETVAGGRYMGVDGKIHDAQGHVIDAVEPAQAAQADSWGGMATALVRVLVQAGYATPDAVRAADDDEIVAIKGLGQKALARIREALG